MLPVLLAAYLAAQGADTATTMALWCADRGHGIERNPVLGSLVDSPAIFGAVSLGTAAALSGYLRHVAPRHPRLVRGIVVALVCVEAGAAVHNAHVLRK